MQEQQGNHRGHQAKQLSNRSTAVTVQVGQTVPMVFLRVLHINSGWIEARGVAHPRAGVTTGE